MERLHACVQSYTKLGYTGIGYFVSKFKRTQLIQEIRGELGELGELGRVARACGISLRVVHTNYPPAKHADPVML